MKVENPASEAQKLQWTLIGIIVFGVIVGIAGVWFLNTLLTSNVAAKNDAGQAAQASANNLERAQTLKIYLESHKDEAQKAAMIVAETTGYRYQNQIVEDITKYANIAGVQIVGFDFPQDINSATVDKATGLKSLTATITLADSVQYTSYLTFLKYIEQNLTKIQITDILISPSIFNQNYLNNTSIGIQVYVQ